ncbi:Arm DNA-binding domain-containing protein [Marivita hallyeonensis]|uniref:Arm DNA-binding domain-containing protein n=1 Tax=Marivita hallyeonensis TaxID=996342 RepID=UPI001FE76C28|nr:Arm DNA-binding domain-containing protein [Marivita hallyeonensis]
MKNTLTAIAIKKAGDGKLFDGGGLTLVKKNGSGKWVYRYTHLGKRREMGLGAWPTVGLADVRTARDGWAQVLASGRDPITVRSDQEAEAIA